MAGIAVNLEETEAALAFLDRAIGRTDDKQRLFEAIGGALVTSTQKRFEDEKGPDGKAWPPSLRARLTGGRTLTDTARLVSSITFEATADRLAVGTNVIYAAIHQMGGTIKAKTKAGLRFRAPGNGGWVRKSQVEMPARPFLGLDEEDNKEIAALAADWLSAEDDGGAP